LKGDKPVKKLGIVLLILIVVIGAGSYFAYKKALNVVADKMIDQVANQLTDADIQQIKNDPDVKALLASGNPNDANLPFTTKKEAIQRVTQRLSIGDLKELASMASGGLTAEEKEKIKTEFESKFSPEEIKALKVVAYKELNK
jgi:copper homeostasis protein CutC